MCQLTKYFTFILLLLVVNKYSIAQNTDNPWSVKGDSLFKARNFIQSKAEFQKAIEFEINNEHDMEKIALLQIPLGTCDLYLSNYDDALEAYNIALKHLTDSIKIATTCNNISMVYKAWGDYDIALEYSKKALKIDMNTENPNLISRDLNNIGVLYYLWGMYDKSAGYFEQALNLFKESNTGHNLNSYYNNLGTVYKKWGKYDVAYHYYNTALKLDSATGKPDAIATRLSNIGGLYAVWEDNDQALKYFHLSAKTFSELSNLNKLSGVYNNIGDVYNKINVHDSATYYFNKALASSKATNHAANCARYLNNLGTCYLNQNRLDSAIYFLNQSIEKKEEIRQTAPLEIRREFLASQILTYQHIIYAYYLNNDLSNLYHSIELSKAKVLAEKLSQHDNLPNIASLSTAMKEQKSDELIISFANIDSDHPLAFCFNSEKSWVTEINMDSLISEIHFKYKKSLNKYLSNQISLKYLYGSNSEADNVDSIINNEVTKKIGSFSTIIQYYREYISRPVISYSEKDHVNYFSSVLYKHLLKDALSQYPNIKEITIIPDGILGFLPFETLFDENCKYLIETYDIQYSYSVTSSLLIEARKYDDKKGKMLALGGAVYNPETWNADMKFVSAISSDTLISNNKARGHLYRLNSGQLRYVRKLADKYLSENSSFSKIYQLLGYKSWYNLPGTLSEIQSISAILENVDTLIGSNASEHKIKEMSANGKLKEYEILHFSLHGIGIPEIPELSALIFSQNDTLEDGYLRMEELGNLSIEAEFVSLSACETGLGKIYKGEGVVGLAQSLLVAGANGLSVSLWQVADESTAIFMTELYKISKDEELSYFEAINKVKRNFINAKYKDTWKNPFYWAPFVYYGK